MKKIKLFILISLVLFLGIGMSAKAASSKEENMEFDDKQYQLMEEKYVKEVRLLLLEKGCKNAGVSLTYIIDLAGNKGYTVTIHHAKLEKMKAMELSLLKAKVQECGEKILFTDVKFKIL